MGLNLDEYIAAYPPPAPARLPLPPPPGNNPRGGGGRAMSDAEWAVHCARAYAARVPGAVANNGGHNHTFKLACDLANKFGLEYADVLSVLKEWNPKCDPPWKDPELEHKADDAVKKVYDKPNGHGVPKRGQPAAVRVVAPAPAPPLGDPPVLGFPAPAPDPDADDRPDIVLDADIHVHIETVIEALAADPDLYQRDRILFRVARAGAPDAEDDGLVRRAPETPFIVPVGKPRLAATISRRARLWQRARRGDDYQEVRVKPPEWLINGVHDYGEYGAIPKIRGIVESPIIKPDGTLLIARGYDKSTGVLYEPNGAFPLPPRKPTRDDATDACHRILEIVQDFPFKAELDKFVWLSALLTPFARYAIDAPCPLNLMDANSRGAGKSRLCDIVSIVLTGRKIPRTVPPDADDEWRKRITSLGYGSDRLCLLDNLPGIVGSPVLDAALTSVFWKDRRLGHSEMTTNLELTMVWYATGNNVAFRGDIARRVIPCRLVSRVPDPEHRTGFKQENIDDYVLHNRPTLVRDCLTILAAYCQAGRPSVTKFRLGSYEAWSDLVRSAVMWLSGVDVVDSQASFTEQDPQTTFKTAFIRGWAELCENYPDGLTAAHAHSVLKGSPDSKYRMLKDILLRSSDDGELMGVNKLTYKLRDHRDGVVDNLMLVAAKDDNATATVWRTEVVHGSMFGD